MQYLPTSLLYSIWSILGCILNVFTMNKTIGKNIFENKSELFFNLVVFITKTKNILISKRQEEWNAGFFAETFLFCTSY